VSAVHTLLALPSWLVLACVALLPALEASTLVGLVVPGETAVLAGGVAAHAGSLPLWAVILAAVGGAALGDQVGYALGRRYGPRLLHRLPRRMRAAGSLERALSLVRRRGAVAVVLGRWAAALRALVPGVAGMSGVSRGRFTLANLAGGALWAAGVAVAGYLAGASYTVLERWFGLGGETLLGAAVVLVGLWAVRGHWLRVTRRRRQSP
jgi:membrane-associated protein